MTRLWIRAFIPLSLLSLASVGAQALVQLPQPIITGHKRIKAHPKTASNTRKKTSKTHRHSIKHHARVHKKNRVGYRHPRVAKHRYHHSTHFSRRHAVHMRALPVTVIHHRLSKTIHPAHHDVIVQPPAVPDSWIQYNHPHLSYHHHVEPELPLKPATNKRPVFITLRDAILLALRHNPAIETAELSRITDKYSWLLAKRAFVPKYTLGGAMNFGTGQVPSYSFNPSVSIKTPIGTQLNLGYSNTITGGQNIKFGTVTFSATQPLLKGFGEVNKFALRNAYDAELSARLSFKQSIISTVDSVINSYRSLVQDYNSLKTQKQNLKASEITLKQNELKVKVGQQARSNLVIQRASLESNRLSYVQQQQSVRRDYLSFLQVLGLTLSAKLNIDKNIHIRGYKVPSKKAAIKIALAHNTGYRTSVIQLRSAERSVITAKNNRLPTLNAAVTQTYQSGMSGGGFMPIGSAGTSSTAYTLTWSIPVDDVEGKSAEVGAEIGLEKAKIALEQAKEMLITTVTNDIEDIKNTREQVAIGQRTVELDRIAYKNSRTRLHYGQATQFEVTQDQNTLLNDQISLIGSKIAYLNAIEQLYSELGITLQKWKIRLRY